MTLLVEDDSGVRWVVRNMLQQIGCVVQEAVDGKQALESVSVEQPDVVVLDVLLPDMNGLEVMVRLQSTGVPIVAMTGSLIPSAVMREKGAHGVLRKPFSIRDLRRAIEKATATRADL